MKFNMICTKFDQN